MNKEKNKEQILRVMKEHEAVDIKTSYQAHMDELKCELDRIIQKEKSSSKAYLDLQNKERHLENIISNVNSEKHRLTLELNSKEEFYCQKLSSFEEAMKSFVEVKHKFNIQIEELTSKYSNEKKIMQEELQILLLENESLKNDQLRGVESHGLDTSNHIETLTNDLNKIKFAYNEAQNHINHLQQELQNEKAECSALRLRVNIQRKPDTIQPKLSSPISQNLQNIFHGGRTLKGKFLSNQKDSDDIPSPQFSEDFGPISLPNSPTHTLSPGFVSKNKKMYSSSYEKFSFNHSPQRERSYSDSFTDREKDFHKDNEINNALVEENTKLKKVIKDMRDDLEILQLQSLPSTETKSSDQKVTVLEERLKQSIEEISKLRSERRRLMEIGNELRAELNQYKRKSSSLKTLSDLNSSSQEKISPEHPNPSPDEEFGPEKSGSINPWSTSYKPSTSDSNERANDTDNLVVNSQRMDLELKLLNKKFSKDSVNLISKPVSKSVKISNPRKVMNYAIKEQS